MSFMDQMLPVERAEELAQALELPDSVIQWIASTTWNVFGTPCTSFEVAVKENFPDVYQQTELFLAPHKHAFASRLPYLNPWHVVFSILGYFVLLIAFTIIGKILGKHSYKGFGILHNLFLHLLSLYMFTGLLFSARAANYSLWNNAAGTSEKDYRVAKFVWLFYVSKVPEWIDTVLMLLKHNYRQVSFLHVYHHLSIYAIWWLASFKAPGGEAYYSAMVNSGVHVFMYGYYFLTMIFPTGPVRRLLNNFKFVITKGQMTQFFFNCLQSVYDLAIVPTGELKYSRGLLWLLFWYMISLLALFGNFLVKNKKRPREVYSPFASPVSSPVSTTTNGRRSFKDMGPNGDGHSNGHSNGYSNGHSNGHSNGYSNGHSNGHSDANGNGTAVASNGNSKAGMTKAQLREVEKKSGKNGKKK